MRSLAGSLSDGVLTDAITPSLLLPPTNIRIVRSPRKKYGKPKYHLLVNEKRRCRDD